MGVAGDQALKGWHPGERTVQNIMNLPMRVSLSAVVNQLPDQHRVFHSTRLHYLPVTTLDDDGRPWASMLTAKDGRRGFISSPSPTKLQVHAHVWDSDPIVRNVSSAQKRQQPKILISAIGLEPSTRRRNKFSGHVEDADLSEGDFTLDLNVNQALGLCPKYINVRELVSYLNTHPRTVYDVRHMKPEDRLPQDVIDFILNADTAYIGTSYVAKPEDEENYPSHLTTNHRGGRPGFVRVRKTDDRTVVLPNYAGNRLMNSLGNIQITPLASLVFPSFTDGSILYITGEAQNLFGKPARDIMPESNVITTIKVTGYVFVQDALPLREAPNAPAVVRSPYSPPVRYLAEETPPANRYDDVMLFLQSAKIHTDTLATFTFESSRPIDIGPSQNVVLELSEFLRVRSHEFVDWVEGKNTENDDCVRTWTVSVPPTPEQPRRFSITVRQIKGGLITPIMYQVVHKVAGGISYDQDISLAHLNITAKLRGIGGDLPVPQPVAGCDGSRRLLWVAGGIGITPFLSLTRYIANWVAQQVGVWDIAMVLSTREPEAILLLITDAMAKLNGVEKPTDLSYVVHLFNPSPETVSIPAGFPSFVKVKVHGGRLPSDGRVFESVDASDREPHICGPLPFVLSAMEGMKKAGVNPEDVKRERFTY